MTTDIFKNMSLFAFLVVKIVTSIVLASTSKVKSNPKIIINVLCDSVFLNLAQSRHVSKQKYTPKPMATTPITIISICNHIGFFFRQMIKPVPANVIPITTGSSPIPAKIMPKKEVLTGSYTFKVMLLSRNVPVRSIANAITNAITISLGWNIFLISFMFTTS